MLTVEMLQADLDELNAQHERAIATLNAISGAQQYIEGKIKELTNPVPESEKGEQE